MDDFHAGQPIFVQIRQRLIAMVLNRSVPEGEALPSVRQVAADLSVNPLTVTRAYDALVESGAVEKRRGLGMYVAEGARDILMKQERKTFLEEDWPLIAARIVALDLNPADLLATIETRSKKGHDNE